MNAQFFIDCITHARTNEIAMRILTSRVNHLSDSDYHKCIQAMQSRLYKIIL